MGNVVITTKRWYEIDTDQILRTFKITMSSSYATNGDTITAADIKKLMPSPNDLTRADVIGPFPASGGHTAWIDKANKKVKAFNGTAEIANGTNLSAVSFDAIIIYEDTEYLHAGVLVGD